MQGVPRPSCHCCPYRLPHHIPHLATDRLRLPDSVVGFFVTPQCDAQSLRSAAGYMLHSMTMSAMSSGQHPRDGIAIVVRSRCARFRAARKVHVKPRARVVALLNTLILVERA